MLHKIFGVIISEEWHCAIVGLPTGTKIYFLDTLAEVQRAIYRIISSMVTVRWPRIANTYIQHLLENWLAIKI